MRKKIHIAAACSLLALGGCDQIDPLKRPYMWHDTGVNASNIAAMAANPDDLVHGRDSRRRPANMDADGVDRLWSGKPLQLPGSGSGSGGGSGGSAPPASGGT